MFFFGKNLKPKHKATLCLVVLGILANFWLCTKRLGTFAFVEFLADGSIKLNLAAIILSFGIFVKMLVIIIFRKF